VLYEKIPPKDELIKKIFKASSLGMKKVALQDGNIKFGLL
jgi:hypothetical protein